MLPTHLSSNEVRNAAGTEVEFLRRGAINNGTGIEFAASGESPSLPHRLKVGNQEIGSGTTARRRSFTRVDKTSVGKDGSPVRTSVCQWVDIPVGNIDNLDDAKACMAELNSFVAGNGTNGVLVNDGTGTGAASMINGTQ